MSHPQVTDLICLGAGRLAWARLARNGRQWELEASGAFDGEPVALLDRWAQDHSRPGAAIRLYDARPRYYCFTTSFPAAALARVGGAVTLKVRQELGVEDGLVSWAARAEKPAPGEAMALRPGHVGLFVVVARRVELEVVRLWAERHCLAGRLWVGADVDAARCLAMDGGGVRPPAVLVASDGVGAATTYRVDAHGGVAKGRLGLGCAWNDAGLADGAGRVTFEGVEAAWLEGAAPALAGLEARPVPSPGQWNDGEALGDSLRAPKSDSLLTRDPVLLGAARDLTARREAPWRLRLASTRGGTTAMTSLLAPVQAVEEELGGGFLDDMARHLPSAGRLARVTSLAGAALALSLFVCWGVSRSAQSRLSAATAKLAVPVETLRSQQAVLQRIAAERKPLLPVIQAILDVAPNGLALNNLTVGPGGRLSLAGAVNGRDDADAFTRRLSKSPLLTGVEAPEIKTSQGKTVFTLTARVIDRQRQTTR